MKNTKTQIILWLILTLSTWVSAFAAIDASIKSVNVTDSKTLSVELANTVDGLAFTGDAKVLKDLPVKSATKDATNSKVVNIVLGTDLVPDTSYSILSIFWAEGNIDFALKGIVANAEYANAEPDAAIEKIVVKDSKDIDVYYKLDIKSTEFEYKVLSNLWVDTITKDAKTPTSIVFNLKNPLEKNLWYILMLVSLKNEKWDDINFSEGIYDFNSGNFADTMVASSWAVLTWTTLNTTAVTWASPSWTGTAVTATWVVEWKTQVVDLNSAAVITENTSANDVQNKLIEEVAAKASNTPDTGPETWILILGTLIINTVLFYTRRKNGKIA